MHIALLKNNTDDPTGDLRSGRPTGYHSGGFQAIKGNRVLTRAGIIHCSYITISRRLGLTILCNADTWPATRSQREAKPSPF
ncbi:hypothetical protein N7505_007339 [Penicillium chrysogenum]|uniref:Uncharacterized protein n=1 Tax=Penicillium chrysogenum TaxID=5076 RepID=A0ABQ8WD27_PENCH|nr:hypothetical protein N7505_007339 [Penicillium chrysogenum]